MAETREQARVARLTKKTVDAAKPAAARYALWDSDLKGFGVRVSPHGVKTYVVRYRAGGGRTGTLRQLVLGRHGPITADEARDLARKNLAEVTKGGDPQAAKTAARQENTVTDLCDLYLAEGVATKKLSTLVSDKTRIERHIKPLLGARRVSTVTRGDVEKFMQDVAEGKTAVTAKPTRKAARAAGEKAPTRKRNDPVATGGKGTATRTVGLLGGIFEFAVTRRMRPDNPVRGVKRYAEKKFERFLSPAELSRLGKALGEMETAKAHPYGLAVIRLLALTGARKSEIEGLRWREVDLARAQLRLEDSKTGRKILRLSPPAIAILDKVESDRGGEWVFPARSGDGHYVGTPRLWETAKVKADLQGVRLHDLRHTFASFGAAGGFGLPVIGALLGHSQASTTARYAHLADDPLKQAGDHIAAEIGAALGVGN